MVFKKRKQRRSRRSYRNFRPRFRTKDKRIAILPTVAALAPLLDSANNSGVLAKLQAGQAPNVHDGKMLIDQISQHYIGFAPFAKEYGGQSFQPAYLLNTYGGITLGYLGHKVANKTGANRAIAKIPFVGKHICL